MLLFFRREHLEGAVQKVGAEEQDRHGQDNGQDTMPPVEDEGGDEVRDEPAEEGGYVSGQVKDGAAGEPSLPGDSGELHHSELDDVHGHDTNRPSADAGQTPAWDDALENEAGDEDRQDGWQHDQ